MAAEFIHRKFAEMILHVLQDLTDLGIAEINDKFL